MTTASLARFGTALAVLLAPAAGRTECPGPDDMARGVILKTAAGNTELHRRTGPERSIAVITFGDGGGSIMEFAHGIYAIGSVPVTNGKPDPSARSTFTSPTQALRWPVPSPSARWTTEGQGGARVESGPETEITLGACSYRGFKVTLGFTDEPDYSETYLYLPALGIALLTRTTDAQGPTDYAYISIAGTN
jgi:hypothetical protein